MVDTRATIEILLFLCHCSAVATSSSSDKRNVVHLKFSVIVAEASFSEAERPRLRAWEQTHVGRAHGVAEELERLGLTAFCDPEEVNMASSGGA